MSQQQETVAEQLFLEIAEQLAAIGVQAGSMFGKRCLKTGGKAMVALHGSAMAFKLDVAERLEALGLAGSCNWDPSGKGRPMREWVEVPVQHSEQWPELASAAARYLNPLG